jgi:hypothetical protein
MRTSQNELMDWMNKVIPKDGLAQGLSAAFNSDQTPAFGQMVANLFQNSSPEQKSGLLNKLLAAAGPGVLAKVFAGKAPSALPSGSSQVTPETASQITPEAVEAIATETHKQNPSIVDSISGFYVQHPTLIKVLGATAMTIAMAKMSKRAA